MVDKKNSFVPYRYIKEFYNTERLILPAVRDTVLNGIFLGGAKSTEKGDTLLDTVNYPIFDLWSFIISQYRYSFFETTRGELIVVPDMMSCLPPLCNVVFPDEYVHYGRNIDLRGVTTRFFEQGYMTLTGNDSYQFDNDNMDKQVAAQQAFVGPTSDVEPWMYKVIAGECTPREIPSSTEGDNFEAYTQIPLPEEFHYGANYKTGSGEYLSRMSEEYVRTKLGSNDDSGVKVDEKGSDPNQDKESMEAINLVEEYNNYHKYNVLYKYFLSRLYSQKTENIRITFTPRLVVGLPILLFSRTGKHLLGLLTNLSHHLNAEGIAETIVTVEYQYNYDDITKRPVYFYRQGEREKLIQEGEDSEDESTYVWKNYFMLSAYFRDKYIGEKMYKNILSDGIEKYDYNLYALKGLKDQSILGILNTSDIDKKSSISRELDKAYFDDDRPNVSGEIQSIPIGSEQAFGLTEEMETQKRKMAYAIEKIWAGYLTAYNKDVYRAKFDIYPLRDFDYWMKNLGAYRQSTGNFAGGGIDRDWVAVAEKEMNTRSAAYIKKQTEKEEKKEEERKKIIERKKKLESDIKKKDNEIKEKEKELKEAEIRKREAENKRNPPFPRDNTNVQDPNNIKDEVPDPNTIQNDIDKKTEERLNLQKDLKDAQNALKELKIPVKFKTTEKWKTSQEKLFYNEDYRKYDLNSRKFTTNGPFCKEKQEYFRDVYAKQLKEFHFDTEFRNFEVNPQKPKDIGNEISKIVHQKGPGYTGPDSKEEKKKKEDEEKKKKEEQDIEEKRRKQVQDETTKKYSDVKKYVAALWALTNGYGNDYAYYPKEEYIMINTVKYNLGSEYFNDTQLQAIRHYLKLMIEKVSGLWAELDPDKRGDSWKPVKGRPSETWKETWEYYQDTFANYSKKDYQYAIMEEMWVVYEKLVTRGIIKGAPYHNLK